MQKIVVVVAKGVGDFCSACSDGGGDGGKLISWNIKVFLFV